MRVAPCGRVIALVVTFAVAGGPARGSEEAVRLDEHAAQVPAEAEGNASAEDRPTEIRRSLARIETALQTAGARSVPGGSAARLAQLRERVRKEGYVRVAAVNEDGSWDAIFVGYSRDTKVPVIVISGRDPTSFRRTGTFLTVETVSPAVAGPDGRTDLTPVEDFLKKNADAHVSMLE